MEKVASRSSSIWDDAGLAMTSAPNAFTTEDLQVLFGVPSNEIVGCHIHKLVQVVNFFLSLFLFLLGFERWILFSGSGGDYSHYLRVPESGGKGYIHKVQVAGYGGRELKE